MPRCPTCGGDPEICGDPQRDWFPNRTVCFKDREQKVAERRYRALYTDLEWHDGTGQHFVKDFSPTTPFRYDDGVTISVTPTDESPGETWLEKRQA